VPAPSPEALSRVFAQAINSRDLPAALELWTEDAAIIGPAGDRASGLAEIRAALQALLDNGVTVRIEVSDIFATGDVAIATGSFEASGTGADGEAFSSRSSSVVVYTRTADGWRIALDAPWGLPEA
jgi:uncharacterized protein (TIGR02246 family)